MNAFCREKGIGFILSETLGLAGYAFLDYTDKFYVNDADGEPCKSFIIVNITQEEQGVVTVHEDKRHSYQDGDYVKFVEVEGMTELNNREPVKISGCTKDSFKIELDTRGFGAYKRQGVVENIKVPKLVSFHSLKQSIENPVASSQYGMLETPDLRYFGRSDQIHLAVRAVHAFNTKHSRYPEIADEDIEQVLAIATEINEAGKGKELHYVEEIEADVLKNTARFSSSSISPQAAFFGGIVAQEIVKFTGKYTPLKQWLHYDVFETLPTGEVDRTPRNSRYDDQIKIFGREVQDKLFKVNTFMVGAGALGCEYIKSFALMGIGCGPDGHVAVTDNDNIEVSNLNRQFLFRKGNVGHSKSECAAAIAKGMNPALNVKAYTTRVGSDTESVFHDKFWERLDFVVNAVDNINARLYVDSRCVWYEKPLLESGTLGTKANSQMIVPHKTQCYGDSQDPPEESIPLCTLRNFPNQIEHCIEWGRAQFSELFTDRAADAISFLENQKVFVGQLKQNNTSAGFRSALEEIKKIVDLKKSADFTKCVLVAREIFDTQYDHNIRDLLSAFPEDHLDSHGSPFWSGPKRAPRAITFDVNDETHLSFVLNASNLIAANLGLTLERDPAKIREFISSVQPKAYVPKAIKVETPEEEKAREEAGQPAPSKADNDEAPDDDEALRILLEALSIDAKTIGPKDIIPADFEKDDDTNFHIDFITASANLRARNYKITEADRNKTKMIAGKIIPAIATTTAMVTGAVGMELYKYAQGFTDIEKFKNSFINLALPLFLFSEPDEVKKITSKEYDPIMFGPVKAIPDPYTIYDKVVVQQGSLTFQQFFDSIKASHNVDCTMVACGKMALYNAYLPGGKHEARKSKIIQDVYSEISDEPIPDGRQYLIFDIGGETCDDGADFQMPPIKYTWA